MSRFGCFYHKEYNQRSIGGVMTQAEAAPSPQPGQTFETTIDSSELVSHVECLREAYKAFRLGRRDELAYSLMPIIGFLIRELQARGEGHLVEMPPNEPSQGREIRLS
jgi:hypothetical protein